MREPIQCSTGNKFIILARKEDGIAIYQQEPVHVEARSWDEAYQKVRDGGFKPIIDEYKTNN